MLAGSTDWAGFAVAAGYDAVSAVLWGLAVIVVIVLGGMVVLWLRKRLLGREVPDDGGFATLETLRQQGLVTEEELRDIRRKVIDRHQAREREKEQARTAGKSNLTFEDKLSDLKKENGGV